MRKAVSEDTVSVGAQHGVQCPQGTAFPESPFVLGPLDQLTFPFVPIDVIYVYERPARCSPNAFMSPQALRESLSHLLSYYPHLTGRLQINPSKVFEIGQLGRGIAFLEAECKLRLSDAASLSPSGRVVVGNLPGHGNALMPPFHPTMEGVCSDPIFTVQHTRFACGGVALGIRVHHFVCDAFGFFQLVRDWAAIHRRRASRDVLGPLLESPPDIHGYLLGENDLSAEEKRIALEHPPLYWYVEDEGASKNTLPSTDLLTSDVSLHEVQAPEPPITGRTLHFSSKALVELKQRATNPSGSSWVSAFEAISAYLCHITYRARLRLLNSEGISASSAASRLCRGFWASIDMRDPGRLNLGPRYFSNGALPVLTRLQHDMLSEGQLWQVAEVIHGLMRSVDKEVLERSSKWFAAQPDKSRVRVDFEFGKGNFTVSQWSKHDMYADVGFERDSEGYTTPTLVAPPFTQISLVDGLGTIISSPPGQSSRNSAGIVEGAKNGAAPRAVDVNFSISDPLWAILDEDETFRGYCL